MKGREGEDDGGGGGGEEGSGEKVKSTRGRCCCPRAIAVNIDVDVRSILPRINYKAKGRRWHHMLQKRVEGWGRNQ